MQLRSTDFKTVKYHWFECPQCRHRSWTVAMRSQYSTVKPHFLLVCRCERCGQLFALSNWRYFLPRVVVSVILFLVLYKVVISGLSLPLILFVGLAAAAVTVVLDRLMGRWLNRYVAFNDINP
jgi:hypothetical protein